MNPARDPRFLELDAEVLIERQREELRAFEDRINQQRSRSRQYQAEAGREIRNRPADGACLSCGAYRQLDPIFGSSRLGVCFECLPEVRDRIEHLRPLLVWPVS